MNIEKLKIIEDSLEYELITQLIREFPLFDKFELYDLNDYKDKTFLIESEDEDEEGEEIIWESKLENFVNANQTDPHEIESIEIYFQKVTDQQNTSAKIVSNMKGELISTLNLIVYEEEIIGFANYFYTTIPEEINIEKYLRQYNSLSKIESELTKRIKKYQTIPIDTKILANKYFKETNMQPIMYEFEDPGILKTIGLTEKFIKKISLK